MQRLLEDHYRHYKNHLSNLLLTCPVMRDRYKRDYMLRELPERIRNQLNSNLSTPMLIAQNLIETCSNYEEGERELWDLLRQYESNSKAFQNAKQAWQVLKKKMDEQERLVAWVKQSAVSFPELRQIFTAVTPQDYAYYFVSVEELVVTLWETQTKYGVLLAFMERLQKRPELPVRIRNAVHSWCVEAKHNGVLKLPDDGETPINAVNKTRIIVKIEPRKQDPSAYSAAIWVDDHQGKLELVNEWMVAANQLELEISNVIEEEIIGLPRDAVTVEFYVPKGLLSLPVDTWRKVSGIQKQRFIERFKVTKGLLERQEARNILVELRTSARSEQKKLLKVLKNNPFMFELTDCFADWETRWRQLQCNAKRRYIDVVQPVNLEEPLSINKDTCFAPLTFAPSDLDLKDNNDPLVKLLIAGVPLIAWVRSGDNSAEFALHVKQHLFETHCTFVISSADDIIDLMHEVCRKEPDAPDPYQIGNNLNLIVDNPESKLPRFGRVLM